MGGVAAAAELTFTTGLTAWYKADALVLSNDDPVTAWVDSSSNDADLAEVTAPPTYKTNIKNSLPAVLFDGTNDRLSTTDTQLLAVQAGDDLAFTAFLALAPDLSGSATTNALAWVESAAVAGGGAFMALQVLTQTGQNNWRVNRGNNTGSGASIEQAVEGIVDDAWIYVAFTYTGTAITLHTNGTVDATISATALNTTSLSEASAFALGCLKSATPQGFYPGYIGEVLVYNAALSDSNRASVEAYLASKWDIE